DPTVSVLNDHRLKSPSRGKRRRTPCRAKEAQVVPAKKRPPAVETILKQILMFGFFILLSSYEIDLYNYNKLYIYHDLFSRLLLYMIICCSFLQFIFQHKYEIFILFYFLCFFICL